MVRRCCVDLKLKKLNERWQDCWTACLNQATVACLILEEQKAKKQESLHHFSRVKNKIPATEGRH